MFRRSLVVVALAFAAGCIFPKAGTVPGPASAATLEVARSRFPEATEASLERGRELFADRCDGCHAIPDLAPIPAEKWSAITVRMGDKAGMKAEDTELVRQFILAVREGMPATK